MIRRFMWSLRRELWENRWLWVVPSGIGAALLVGFIAYAFRLPGTAAALAALDAAHIHQAVFEPYDVVAGVMMGIGLLIAFIYCVDALYSERRDRSVLLWKSLPVSDLETVLAKLCVPVLVLPLICWVLTMALQILLLAMTTAILAGHPESAAVLRAQPRLLPNAIGLLYHLVALHGVAMSPIYGWLLLVSAWAPRAPLAWAIVPPAVIGVFERIAFGTTRFAQLLIAPMGGGTDSAATAAAGSGLMDQLMLPSLGNMLAAPALWIGLAIAALFVLGAVRLRRSAQPV
jgi:ABC-2 type transport system permease protein